MALLGYYMLGWNKRKNVHVYKILEEFKGSFLKCYMYTQDPTNSSRPCNPSVPYQQKLTSIIEGTWQHRTQRSLQDFKLQVFWG